MPSGGVLVLRCPALLFVVTSPVHRTLGRDAKAFGGKFDLQVHALAKKGLSIRAIARVLKVSNTTVLKRSKRRHKGKPHR
jgi:transposase-like protein